MRPPTRVLCPAVSVVSSAIATGVGRHHLSIRVLSGRLALESLRIRDLT